MQAFSFKMLIIWYLLAKENVLLDQENWHLILIKNFKKSSNNLPELNLGLAQGHVSNID